MPAAQLPASMQPTEIRNPAPKNTGSRRQYHGERKMLTLECTSGKEGSVRAFLDTT